MLQRKPDSGQIDCKCVWSPDKPTKNNVIQFLLKGPYRLQRCTKYSQAMTSRQALAKMFMYASITHCQGKITQRALALWHLHSWHLDVPPKACNSRREIQGPKGPVLSCQSTGETIGNTSAFKKLAERIYTATKKEYEYYIISR